MTLIFSKGMSNNAFSLKVILISTIVLSAAVAVKISVPVIAEFAVTDAPSIYNGVISWLKPPYLYLVINCIIISIVASSKLQSKVVDSESSPMRTLIPDQIHVHTPIISPIKHYNYDDFLVNGEEVEEVRTEDYRFANDSLNTVVNYKEINAWGNGKDEELIESATAVALSTKADLSDPIKHYNYGDFLVNGEEFKAVRSEDYRFSDDSLNTEVNYKEITALGNSNDEELIKSTTAVAMTTEADISHNSDEKVFLSKSSWSPSPLIRRDSSELFDSNEKPLLSARFSHRRSAKASPEGGKTALRVSKSRKQETMENTWKTLTDGRAIPLARHLKKSDTWESRGGGGGGGGGGRHHIPTPPNDPKMTKAETFNEHSSSSNSLQSSSPGDGPVKLKREASLSQDELNKRVEAFIKKFNEEMRLQRQESLSQYAEMRNWGAH